MDAFEDELLKALPHLRAFARSLTRNRHRAEDLVHDAVVRALQARDQFESGTNFKAWAFTILRNLYYNQGRSKHKRNLSMDDRALETELNKFNVLANRIEERLMARQALKIFCTKMPPEHAEIIRMVSLEELSYEDAALQLGVRVGTIKSRVSRGREIFQSYLEILEQPTPRKRIRTK